MKKGLSLFLSLLITLSLCLSAPFALKSNAATVDDLTFELKNDGKSYYVSDCNESASGELVIPDTYNGLPVTTVGGEAFLRCDALTNVKIPDSVTVIGNYAFERCTSLTSVTIPANVSYLGYWAFYGCSSLSSITIPDSVTGIDSAAFYGTYYYNNSSNWKNDVLYIGNHLIKSKTSLSGDYVIKLGTKSIAIKAFYECSTLTSVTIPDSVIDIGASAFYGCESLVNCYVYQNSYAHMYVLEENLKFTFLGANSIDELKFSLNSDNSTYSCNGFIKSEYEYADLLIPSTYKGLPVTVIGDSAFENCKHITSVTISDSVISIGSGAFSDCSNLNAVYISDLVSWCNIDFANTSANPLYCAKNLYLNGSKVTDLVIPQGVKSIKDCAFYNCTSLTSVTIGSGVTSVGYDAFYNCSNLNAVYISDVASWCNIDFGSSTANPLYYAKNLYLNGNKVTDLVIPQGVTEIKNYAFYGCNSLKSVTIGNGVTSIGNDAFYKCTSLTSVTIPDSVTSIGSSAFYNTAYYNNSSNWENDVLYIGNHLIKTKTSLSGDYVIKTGTKTIANEAFYNCTSLTSVTIPDSVTSIGSGAFSNCNLLNTFYVFSGSLGYEYAKANNKNCVLLDAPITIDKLTFSLNLDKKSYTVTGGDGSLVGVLKIPATYNGLPVTEIAENVFLNSKILKIELPETIERIGNNAFYNTNFYNNSENWENGVLYIGDYLVSAKPTVSGSLTIKSGTKVIADNVFENCADLRLLSVPASVKTIGDSAFKNCTTLKAVMFANGLKTIGAESFMNCTELSSITVPTSVTEIGEKAFYNTGFYNNSENWYNGAFYINEFLIEANKDISGVYEIEDGTKVILGNAFSNCTGLTSIKIPASVEKIGVGAFSNCTGLTAVYAKDIVSWCNIDFSSDFNSNPISYAGNLYLNDSLVTSLEIPSGVTNIKDYAFYGLKSINSLVVPNTVKSIGKNSFKNCSSLSTVKIAGSVEKIDDFAFADCVNLSNLKLNNGVKEVGNSTFINCSALNVVTFSNTLQKIGDSAFKNCSALSGVSFPQSLQSIGDYAFSNCTTLQVLSLNEGLTHLGKGAFYECTGLKNVKIPSTLKVISENAFYNCMYIGQLDISKGVETIGDYAFANCASIKKLQFPEGLKRIGNYSFWCCEMLYSVKFAEGLVSIGEMAFCECTFIKKLEFPESLENIGAEAFAESIQIQTIKFGNSLKSIGDYAFAELYDLKYVFYNNSETEWKNVSIGLGNECLSSAVIHYNSTNHSHSYESLYPVAGQNGLRIDVCPVCSLVLAEETLVYLNDDVAGVAECFVSISEKSKIIYAEVSLCQSPDQFITVREGCQISATPSNSAGFYGTGSIIKILDEKGNLINSYELSVKGDVNGDGFCDALDCMLVELARHKNNNVSLSGAYLMGADFTSEGALTIEDFQAIISYALSVDRCITHEFMDATCTTGPQCVHCGKVSGKPLGHTVEVNPGTSATCYTTGLSDGTYCSSCGETLTQQQVTPKTTHSYDSTGNCINCDDHTADRLKEYVVAKGRKTGSSYVIETQDSDSGFYFRIDYNATTDKLMYILTNSGTGQYFEMTHSDSNTQKVAYSVTFDDGTKMYCWADVNRSTFDNTNRSVSNCTYSSNVSTSTLKSQLKTLAGTQTAAVLSNLELVLLYFFIDIDPSSDNKYLDIESLGFTNFIIQ